MPTLASFEHEEYLSHMDNILEEAAIKFQVVSVEEFGLEISRPEGQNHLSILVKEPQGFDDRLDEEFDRISYDTVATLAHILHACLSGKYRIHVALEGKYAISITTNKYLRAVIVEERLLDYTQFVSEADIFWAAKANGSTIS